MSELQKRAEKAAARVKPMSMAALRVLSEDERFALLDELTAPDKPERAVRRQRDRVMGTLPLDAGFLSFQETVAKALAVELLGDPEIRAAALEWPRLRDAERLEALARLTGIHARVAGFAPVPLSGFYADPKTMAAPTAAYRTDRRDIVVNTHWRTPFSNFPRVAGLVIEMGCHAQQAQWAAALEEGRLRPRDRAWRSARLFRVNLRPGGHVGGFLGIGPSMDQPTRRHAKLVGNTAASRLAAETGFFARLRAKRAEAKGPTP
jgi:hypothetical protein